MRYQDPNLSEKLAGEYVLGTLKGQARKRFERLLTQYPNLRDDVETWELSLNKLAEQSPSIEPPAQLWHDLEQRVFPQAKTVSWYERIALWRGLTAASSLLAIVLAVVLLLPSSTEESANFVVVLNNQTQQPGWSMTTSADMKQFYVRNLRPMDIPKGQGCLLWVQPAGSDRLIHIGRLPDDGNSETTLPISEQLRELLIDGKLTVTVENIEQPPPPSLPVQ